MHKHRDDVAGVPFLFLTASRRPVSRPSSRASSHSTRLIPNRPETPNSAPSSPLAYVFRRPHTPLASPLATGQGSGSYMTANSDSPAASPTLPPAMPRSSIQFANSLPSSPISSHRVLSAKASDFRPYPRPLSAASSNPSTLTALRADTPSPDLWAHGNSKATSNLAIAAPLIPDTSLLSRSGTPNSTLRVSVHPDEEDEENDPFDPFSQRALPRSFHPPSLPEFDTQWANSPSNSSVSDGYHQLGMTDRVSPPSGSQLSQENYPNNEPEGADMLTDGMTPFDVLASVFGASLAPSELEEALAANGYDFERSMAWLVERAAPQHGHGLQHPRSQNLGSRIPLVSRDGSVASGYVRGGRSGFGAPGTGTKGPTKFVNGRPVQTGTRVCRYFLAGECLRADCRFRWVISIQCSRRVKLVSSATKSNVPFVVSGCEEHVQKGRSASFCTTFQQTLMWLVSLPQWAALTLTRVLLVVSRHSTNSRLLITLPGTPEDVVGVIMDGINVRPRLTT
jgi:hypothetical protein